MKKIVILIYTLLISTIITAQTNPVLLPELQSSYEGKIKKGLANGKGKATGIDVYEGYFKKGLPDGKGKYIWPNGDIYHGFFKKGKPDGEGTLTLKIEQRDSVITGIFENGVYKGPKPLPDLKVVRLNNADGVIARKIADDRDAIFVYIVRDARPAPYTNLLVNVTSGSYTVNETYIHIENYVLPLTINLRYTLPGYLSGTIDVNAEFILQNNGQFKVDVKNF